MDVKELHADMMGRFDQADKDRRELTSKVDKGLIQITEIQTRLEEKVLANGGDHEVIHGRIDKANERIDDVEEAQTKKEDRGAEQFWSILLLVLSAAAGAAGGMLSAGGH